MCLEDAPSASAMPADPTALAGLTFDADAQCQAQRGPDAFFCTDFINVRKLYLQFVFAYWILCSYIIVKQFLCV